MPKGKLIVMNGSSVETSTVVASINIGGIEAVVWNALERKLQIDMFSGREYLYDKLNNDEIGEVSEFVSAYTNSNEDANIMKIIHISRM